MRTAAALVTLALAAATAACGSVAAAPDADRSDRSDRGSIESIEAPIAVRAAPTGLRDVMWVGNNWDGTASIVDAHTFNVLKRGVNLIPDKVQETRDLLTDPVGLVFFLAVAATAGQGHNQYVDDMFTTLDGKYLAVSRPSFADVVWIDIRKAVRGLPGAIVREQQMDGYRTDHMQVSNDGRRLLVSDSTARQVIEYSMVDETLPDGTVVKLGDRLRTFESGETPHESNYTLDGERILHASIGRVYTPLDDTDPVDGRLLGVPLTRLGISRFRLDKLVAKLPWDVLDEAVKADRWLQYVDTDSFEVLERWDMKHELAEAGFPGMSSAVRPVALHPDGRRLYLQVSFLHGYVEFDTEAADLNGTTDYTLGTKSEPARGAVTGVVQLENRVPGMPYEQYVNDSAHHGIAISEDGETLCVAGTMDNYAALVDADTGAAQYFDARTTGKKYGKPYWVTEGLDDTCWVSLSDNDAVAVLSTETKKQLAYLPVGNHPQRVRHGYVESGLLP
ncbi:serine/threonine protein kinase [Nocardioides silvaticus]|uniref:Serine/threonine protein kinase n=1 Tax=Nocardioides silvaticus TaxID=2201891 RepID=A0A316TXV2_9ACTN|nr:serine/threonine protein kinase [Nocardioides silvaticus]PWN04556.1 serine/threonine protein kinase [Nocardioides silvaticus]